MSELQDEISFDPRELILMDFVIFQHRNQKRKYTGNPYEVHLKAVAARVKRYTNDNLSVAAAFCHDLFEDTECTEIALLNALSEAGYTKKEAIKIIALVWELTDEFEKEKYPTLNRRQRKSEEAKRLWSVSPKAQQVKYADLIDNAIDLTHNDKGFAKVYLGEMERILEKMDKGNPELYQKALTTLVEAKAMIQD